jgi:hypothetical protein
VNDAPYLLGGLHGAESGRTAEWAQPAAGAGQGSRLTMTHHACVNVRPTLGSSSASAPAPGDIANTGPGLSSLRPVGGLGVSFAAG